MEKWKKRAVDLFASLALGGEGRASVVPYYPQKTEVSGSEERFFKRSSPEAHGISSKRIYNILSELEGEGRANLHNLLILKDGEVIAECSRAGYSTNLCHLSHSMSKTVMGIAICMLSAEGRLSLDERLVNIFPELEYKDQRFAQITVAHLLSMTSGVEFSEAGSVTELSWLSAFFSSGMRFAPGEGFSYNSMNSYVLARVLMEITEGTVCDYLGPRLFMPLGITNYFWELGPEGVEKGGWGLYLSAESWAKIGYTVMKGGDFFGKRVMSEETVRMMCTLRAQTPSFGGDFDYGYHTWVSREPGEILFNGMLGQNVWIHPENGIVAVINCGNNELFQISPALSIIRRALSVDIRDELNRRDYRVLVKKEEEFFDSRREIIPLKPKRGLLSLLGLRRREPFDERFLPILGSYVFPEGKIGLLPLVVLGMQNNLSGGLTRLELYRRGERLYLGYTDGNTDGNIELGLYGYSESVIDVRGEKYILRAMAGVNELPGGFTEYKIEMILPEMPNTRLITFHRLDGHRTEISFSEMPDEHLTDALIERIPAHSPVLGFLTNLLDGRFGEGFISRKLCELFHPTVVGIDESSERFAELYAEELRKRRDESGTVKLLRAVINRFFSEAGTKDEPEEREERPESGFSIKSMFSRILNFGRREGQDSEDRGDL